MVFAYAVGYGSRFMENPQQDHWIAVKRIFLAAYEGRSHMESAFNQATRLTSVGIRMQTGPATILIASRLRGIRVYASRCSHKLGEQEAVKRIAVEKGGRIHRAKSGNPGRQVDSPSTVRDSEGS